MAAEYAESLLKQLTLEEKIKLLSGADSWRTNDIARLGIPKVKTSDGPVGVRGGLWADGVRAASLPAGVSLAATWDPDLVAEVSQILVDECKSKEVDVLLGPTVCIPRTPLGGRNFEAYSEDPFLTGKLAASYINTLQSAGIGACIKHFVANDQETRRFFIDELIPERALREIHLQPFQIAVRDSHPWTVMTAYNKVNGTFCSMHSNLINDILRGEWAWNGLVMSDWFGTNSIVTSVQAGLDLEMPGPVRRRGQYLLTAHREGHINEAAIDKCAQRVLELVYRTGKYKKPDWKESREQAWDLPQHRKILRRTGAEGIVLLKNDKKLLPLQLHAKSKVAFIGPNAARSVSSGGGSSALLAHYETTPLTSFKQSLEKTFPEVDVRFAPGVQIHRYIPLVDPDVVVDPRTGSSGFSMEFWKNMSHSGTPILTEHRPSSLLICYDGLPPELTTGERYSYRGQAVLTPKTTGLHSFSLSTCGPAKLILDGNVLIDIERRWDSPKSTLFMSYASPEERVRIFMEAGRQYTVTVEAISREPEPLNFSYFGEMRREEVMDGARLGFMEETTGDLVQEAVDLAKASDVVIMVVGRDRDWETETSDIDSLGLPGDTNALIEKVLEVNSNVIIAIQAGGPVAMPWIDQASTIVHAWYQGQEQGNCLADVLLGVQDPSGKLPITFPRRLEDNPSFYNHPGGNDKVLYGEGIFVGYRHYDMIKSEPLFPFGFGISYTTWSYSNLQLSSSSLHVDQDGNGTLEVTVDVTNTGDRPGKEIVQFYVHPVTKPRLIRPPRELKGFAKVSAVPGQTVTARATLDRVSVSYWDDGTHRWTVDPNATFAVIAAKDSRDLGISTTFQTGSGFQWIH